MKLSNTTFIRFSCLSLDEQKTMKTMYMGKSNDPQGVGAYEDHFTPSGGSWDEFNNKIMDLYGPESETNKEASVLDRIEDDDDNDDHFKSLEDAQKYWKQKTISSLDDAIKSGLFDQDTRDKLLMHVIQVVKSQINPNFAQFDWMDQTELDNLVRDVVETTYNSLVYRMGGIEASILPRTKEDQELNNELKNIQF